jgi:N-acetylmuramoyl-L-alanine amidase
MIKIKHLKTGLFTALVMCFNTSILLAASPTILVKDINFITANQLEIAISDKTTFKIFTLKNPNRLVIDLSNSKLAKSDITPKNLPDFISAFRSKDNINSLRLVFDLKQKITIEKTRFEKIEGFGKIIAHFAEETQKAVTKAAIKTTNQTSTNNAQAAPTAQSEAQNFISNKVDEFDVETRKVNNPDGSAKYVVRKIPKKLPIIVIDAGHGGKDPGTIGNFARSKEKNITLSYAKELAKQLTNTKRYRAYLTRDDDYFIPLKQRVSKARKIKADLFISIHANAISDKSVSGFSIYTLSEKSSDKQAELLAQKENRADIIAGLDFAGASQDIMKTLIDLSQRESKNSSANFANLAIKSVKTSGIEILQNTHRFAGFAVLTAPDMSSVLIELGYLSNKEEEKELNSISYKRKIATSLVQAIDEFFAKNKAN